MIGAQLDVLDQDIFFIRPDTLQQLLPSLAQYFRYAELLVSSVNQRPGGVQQQLPVQPGVRPQMAMNPAQMTPSPMGMSPMTTGVQPNPQFVQAPGITPHLSPSMANASPQIGQVRPNVFQQVGQGRPQQQQQMPGQMGGRPFNPNQMQQPGQQVNGISRELNLQHQLQQIQQMRQGQVSPEQMHNQQMQPIQQIQSIQARQMNLQHQLQQIQQMRQGQVSPEQMHNLQMRQQDLLKQQQALQHQLLQLGQNPHVQQNMVGRSPVSRPQRPVNIQQQNPQNLQLQQGQFDMGLDQFDPNQVANQNQRLIQQQQYMMMQQMNFRPAQRPNNNTPQMQLYVQQQMQMQMQALQRQQQMQQMQNNQFQDLGNDQFGLEGFQSPRLANGSVGNGGGQTSPHSINNTPSLGQNSMGFQNNFAKGKSVGQPSPFMENQSQMSKAGSPQVPPPQMGQQQLLNQQQQQMNNITQQQMMQQQNMQNYAQQQSQMRMLQQEQMQRSQFNQFQNQNPLQHTVIMPKGDLSNKPLGINTETFTNVQQPISATDNWEADFNITQPESGKSNDQKEDCNYKLT
jgi:hypothetical protein